MKYIRTKEEIREYDFTFDGLKRYKPTKNNPVICIDKKDIIKQANTIEELCDECIVYKDNDEKPINSDMKDYNIYLLLKETIIKGMKSGINCWLKLAIWTEWGLKYVAKMNEKGCLELL